MLRGERPSVDGKHYQVHDAINSPQPRSAIPVMIGGGGERKTLRMVAQYADESNLVCENRDIPRKLAALDEHCERLGRDRSTVTVTKLVTGVIGRTMEEAHQSIDDYVALHGWPEAAADLIRARATIGDPDTFGEQMADLIAAGLDGLTINLCANAHDPELVALAGETTSRAIG